MRIAKSSQGPESRGGVHWGGGNGTALSRGAAVWGDGRCVVLHCRCDVSAVLCADFIGQDEGEPEWQSRGCTGPPENHGTSGKALALPRVGKFK